LKQKPNDAKAPCSIISSSIGYYLQIQHSFRATIKTNEPMINATRTWALTDAMMSDVINLLSY